MKELKIKNLRKICFQRNLENRLLLILNEYFKVYSAITLNWNMNFYTIYDISAFFFIFYS